MGMELSRMAEAKLRLQHRHQDGSWGSLEPRPDHHAPVDHDQEREWKDGRIYVCASCDEQVRVGPAIQGSDPAGR